MAMSFIIVKIVNLKSIGLGCVVENNKNCTVLCLYQKKKTKNFLFKYFVIHCITAVYSESKIPVALLCADE